MQARLLDRTDREVAADALSVVFDVNLPRPRDITTPAFLEIERALLASLDEEVAKMME